MESANLGDFVYFRLIDHYVREQMTHAMLGLMARAMTWAGSIALVLVTLWVIVQGYRIVTGRSRQPMMRLAVDMARIAVMVSAATTMAIGSTHLYDWLTQGLDQEIHSVFTGDRSDTTAEAIDRNLAYTQIAISAIDIVQVPSADHELLAAKSRATLIANFGIASPPMTAAAMSLLYQLALLLWLALAPLFILSLLFEQTKDLFRRWLMYGIGTMFAVAALSAVSAIALEMNLRVAIALWGAKVINGMSGANAEGLSNLALQQGGLGLLLTVLIISVPPMVAKFFRGTLANFIPFSAFGQGMAAVRQWVSGRAVSTEMDVAPLVRTHIHGQGATSAQLDQVKRGPDVGAVGRAEAEYEAAMAAAAHGDPRYWTAQVGSASVSAQPSPQLQREESGPSWVPQFPGSTNTFDLTSPFRDNIDSFISAMRAAGATVSINATLRPVERAYLMHWSWNIAHGKADPQTVPELSGVDIQWAHHAADGSYDESASINAASQMVAAFGMSNLKTSPALQSRHSEGNAIDMTISWSGPLSITDASGNVIRIESEPRDGMNKDLSTVGATYQVIKFVGGDKDKPHWSSDGH